MRDELLLQQQLLNSLLCYELDKANTIMIDTQQSLLQQMYALHDSGSRIPHSSLHSLNIMNVCMYVQLLSHSLTTPSSYRYHISSLWTLCTTQHHTRSTDPSIHPSIHLFIYLPIPTYHPNYVIYLHTFLIILSTKLLTYQPTHHPSPYYQQGRTHTSSRG